MVEGGLACFSCGEREWRALPDPHPSKTMLSDFRIEDRPLRKYGCRRCGVVQREAGRDAGAFFSEYELYAHPPGEAFELQRQAGYARWLAAALPAPASAFEAGSGNGSLLLALAECWPQTRLRGMEPAQRAVDHARRAGADVSCGFVGAAGSPQAAAELAFAVNVIEHVPDAEAFLRALAAAAQRSVAVVHPDGDIAGSELLFGDHLRTITADGIGRLFARCGLRVIRQVKAPRELGAFLLTAGERGTGAMPPPRFDRSLDAARRSYLEAWSSLDGVLSARLQAGAATCFGAGEAAALLRTYAPHTWTRVCAVTADAPVTGGFGDVPFVPYAQLPPSRVLLGVRPRAQRALTERLRRDGHEVVGWSDVVGGAD